MQPDIASAPIWIRPGEHYAPDLCQLAATLRVAAAAQPVQLSMLLGKHGTVVFGGETEFDKHRFMPGTVDETLLASTIISRYVNTPPGALTARERIYAEAFRTHLPPRAITDVLMGTIRDNFTDRCGAVGVVSGGLIAVRAAVASFEEVVPPLHAVPL